MRECNYQRASHFLLHLVCSPWLYPQNNLEGIMLLYLASGRSKLFCVPQALETYTDRERAHERQVA